MCFLFFIFIFFLLCIQQFTAQQAVHLGNPSILSLWSALFCYPFPSFHPLRHIFSDPISWFQNQSGYFSEQTMMSSWQRDTLTGDDPQWECLFLAAVFSPDNCHIPYWRSFLSPFPLYCKDRTATQCLLNQAARAENLFLKQCVELAFLMCPEKSYLTSAIVIK